MAYVDSSDLHRLYTSIRGVVAGTEPKVRQAVAKTLVDIETDAKLIIVAKDIIDTGDLLNSVSHEIDADGLGGEVGPTVDYGIWQEVGTSTQEPRPYMGPAFDRRAPDLDQALSHIADGIGT